MGYKKHAVIPVFVPHRGCPHDCIFCNQKKISGTVNEITKEQLSSLIEESLKSISPDTYTEIGFYGGSFTGIEKEKQLELLETAAGFVKNGRVSQIRLSTRPDYINDDILKYLKDYHVGTIELGAQSLDPLILKMAFRGHTVEDVFRSSKLIKEYGFELGIQTMTGLPGDTPQKDRETAEKVIGIGPSIVRIYPALVIKGTYMEKLYENGSYAPQGLEEAVEVCAMLVKMYEKAGINVIRVGLQNNENINTGPNSEVVAGPVHPAFRQLVESRLALEYIEKNIAESGFQKNNESNRDFRLIISSDSSNISNISGHKKSNIIYLKRAYNFGGIKLERVTGAQKDIRVFFKRI